jgi:MFS family permease
MSENTSSLPGQAVSVRGQWRIMALLMLGAAFVHFNRISISVAGTERLIPRVGIDPVLMGFVYSAYLLCYTLCMTPGGWFIDRFGPRAALMLVGFGSTLFVGLTGLVGWVVTAPALLVAALLVVRSLMGVISAPIHPGSARMISHWIPLSGQSTCNGLVNAAACVGIASTYLLFGQLMDWFGWPTAFLVSAAATGLLVLLWTALAADYSTPQRPTTIVQAPPVRDRQETSPTPRQQFVLLLRNNSLLLLTGSYAALGYFQYLFFYWVQYYFEHVVKLEKETSRAYSSIAVLAMALGMFAGGGLADWASHRLGPRRGRALVAAGGLLAAGIVLALGLLSRDPTLTLICFAVSMACAGASEGPFWTTAVALGGRLGGTSAAILNTGGNAGGLLAPVLTPLFSRFLGWQAGIGLACGTSVLGAVLWWWIDPDERAGRSLPEED